MVNKTHMLIILDGMGVGKHYPGNAVDLALKPNLDYLLKEYPHTVIAASEEAVGLPHGQMGNSEVGHLNIGSGRVMYQDLLKINNEIEDGNFFKNEKIRNNIQKSIDDNKALHFIGLLSDGGVHSQEKHLYALLKLAKEMGQDNVFVHVILDGRDVSPNAGIDSIKRLESVMTELNIGKIATVSGRYYAMDRDTNWERTRDAYNTMVFGNISTGFIYSDVYESHTVEKYEEMLSKRPKSGSSAREIVEASYADGVTDEFIVPSPVMIDGKPITTISNGDSVIFYNFRPDRMRQLVRAFVDEDFNAFSRGLNPLKVNALSMTNYDKTIKNIAVAYGDEPPNNTLGEYLSANGKTQLRIAETEKYAHVTFFFNGGIEVPFENEDRILVPSPKVATFDLQPEMSANEVADKVIVEINAKKYDVIILNFANCDMVGHTGIIPAAIKAIETVDSCLGRVLDALKANDGVALITADHGNVEKMLTDDGKPVTSHTTNLVPLILFNDDKHRNLMEGGKLSDLSPTILELMGMEKPSEMTGHSLLK
ncbi:MAG: 2,3-bisphosphoglycerate-independent phosphoglycerate mutase [Tissierellia bacterium]|nr:2,3-bisphosphoglycerate-independent phosphoglycerate mutase [Tissierellia bacterium]